MKKNWMKWIGVLCCAGLLTGLVGCEPYEPTEEELAAWEKEGLTFSGYQYPIMPLTTKEKVSGLEVERAISVDVTSEITGWGNLVHVEEQYVLKNTSGEDITTTLYYPYVDTMANHNYEWYDFVPKMSVEGQDVTTYYYTDTVMRESGADSFAALKSMLGTETVLPEISADDHSWMDYPVYVYTIHSQRAMETDDTDIDLNLYYTNPDKCKILADRLMAWGKMETEEFLTFAYSPYSMYDVVVFALGGELENLRGEYQYFTDSEIEKEACQLEITEETMNLGQVLEVYDVALGAMTEYDRITSDESIPMSLYEAVVGTAMVKWTQMTEEGTIETIYDLDGFGYSAISANRWCYLYQEVLIPAGESITVSVIQDKDSSYNPMGGTRHANDTYDWFGFEVATGLGSALNITKQTATFELADEICVMADNFIPDEAGVISLDKELHYFYYLTENSMKRNYGSEAMGAKPVIYLYPAEETEVIVKLDLDGELTSTWPKYDDAAGWEVTAKPDGTIFDADGYEYSYLFWEAELMQEMDFSKGFVVSGEDSAEFLREKLSYMGLTPTEYNEFIVYWAPILEQHPYNLISFQWENYNQAAKLEITPTPDNMLRVYMAYQPLDAPVEVEEQALPVLAREGFTVVEWGGNLIE